MTNFRATIPALVVGLLLAGCSSIPASSQANDPVSFDVTRDGTARIVHTNASAKDGETVIRGEVAFPKYVRNGVFAGAVEGRIDIPGSKPLIVSAVEVHAERRPAMMGRRGYFTIHAGKLLPPGSIAHLSYRDRYGDHREQAAA